QEGSGQEGCCQEGSGQEGCCQEGSGQEGCCQEGSGQEGCRQEVVLISRSERRGRVATLPRSRLGVDGGQRSEMRANSSAAVSPYGSPRPASLSRILALNASS